MNNPIRFLMLLLFVGLGWGADKSPLVLDASNRPVPIQAGDLLRLPVAGPFYTTLTPLAGANSTITFPATSTLAGLGLAQTFSGANLFTGGVTLTTAGLTITDVNAVLGTTTGTKWGTATNQKQGWYNATPIVQPTGDVITALGSLGLVATPTISATTLTGIVPIASGGTGSATLAGASIVTGTGASNRVAVWNGTNTQTGTAELTVDGSAVSIPNLRFELANGAAATPSACFASANGQGFYKSGDGVGIAANAAAAVTITSTGITQAGAATFVSGTGAFTHNGSVTVATGKTLTLTDLTSGRIPLVSTAGLITDNAGLLWSTTAGITSSSSGSSNILTVSDSGTTTAVQGLSLRHNTSGTADVGLGVYQEFKAQSTTTASQFQALLQSSWVEATHASRKARLQIGAYDTSFREGVRFEGDGSVAKIGFLGASAVVRPSSTTDLRQGLIDLGLYTTGGASPLDLNGGAFTTSGTITTTNATPSTSTTTGAFIASSGGIGAARASFIRGLAGSSDAQALNLTFFSNQSVDPAAYRAGLAITHTSNSATAGNSSVTAGTTVTLTNQVAGITWADVRGYEAQINTTNATAANTNAYGFIFRNGTSTGTSTQKAAFYTEALSGATTNYAFLSAGAGLVKIGDTTNSTTTTSGSLVTAGGMGIAGDIIGAANKNIRIGNTYLGQYGGNYGEVGYNSNAGNYTLTDYASRIRFTSGGLYFQTAPSGTAADPITFTSAMYVDNAGTVVLGSAAIATNATTGFVYIPTCAGTPTGVPAGVTGLAPMVINSTNNKLYFYSGGAWRDAGP